MAEDIMESCVKVTGVVDPRCMSYAVFNHFYKFLKEDFFMYVAKAYQNEYAVFTVKSMEQIREDPTRLYRSNSEEDCVGYLMNIVNKYSVLNQE